MPADQQVSSPSATLGEPAQPEAPRRRPWWYASLIAAAIAWFCFGGFTLIFFDIRLPNYEVAIITLGSCLFWVFVGLRAYDPDRTTGRGR